MRTMVTASDGSKRYFINDEEVSEARYFRTKPVKKKSQSLIGWKKQESLALAVHPDQVPEVVERNRKLGVYCDYNKDGLPIITSRQERRKLMVAHGHFDRNAGYGDKTKD